MPRAQQPPEVDRHVLRRVAAVATSLSAVIATSVITGPATASEGSPPCALARTDAHHSEGLDTWNRAYPKPLRTLDAVMVFLSFPDSEPVADPGELAADYFPSTSRFFERASYGRFALRPDIQRRWVRMPQVSGSYGIRRDWDAARRGAYLRDAVAAADGVVDFSRYDVVYLVADPDAPGVDSDATKVVNLDRPLRADDADLSRFVTVFEQSPRTAMCSPTRPATSSTCRTSTTGRGTARATGTRTSATGTSWAASSGWPPTPSAGTSGSSAGCAAAR